MLQVSLLSACTAIALVSCSDLPNVDDPRDLLSEQDPSEQDPPSCDDLLENGDFDKGRVSWDTNADNIIYDDTDLPPDITIEAHSGSYFAWLGGALSVTRKLSQRVDALPRASALKLKGKYFVASESLSSVEDTLTMDVVEAATGRVLATPLSLSNVNPTQSGSTVFSWHDLSLDISSDHSTQGFLLRITSVTDAANNTNFLFDTLTLKPSSCP
jgi:hypothetical protein